ncbi:sart-3, partial [Pristionchus pacificus]
SMSDEEVQTSEIEDVESDNSDNNSNESDKEEEEEGEVGEETDDVEMADPEEVEKKIEESRKALESNPTDYDAAMELLKWIRLSADLDELMKAREEIVAKFPLPIDQWLLWIADGKTLEYSQSEMESLFRRALSDSPSSATLWTEFCMWGCGAGTEIAETIYEDALTAVGLRVDEGGTIWESYTDFEEVLMASADEDKREKVLSSLFARCMRIPTNSLKSMRERYDEFAGDKADPSIISSFKSTLKQLVELEKWEKKLEDSNESIEVFHEYLEYEMDGGDPARIQSFYERILEKHSLDENVWLNYTNYLTEHIKIPATTLSVYRRAVRYCASSCALWQSLLLAMEKANIDESEISALWPAAKLNIGTADDGRALYRTYAFLLKRKLDVKGGEIEYAAVADVLDEGNEVLSEYFSRQWDPQGEYRRMQAFFHYNKMKNATKGRLIWDDILASGGGRLADRWIEAATLERIYGNVAHARTLYNKAVNSVADHPQQVFNAFIQFEREEGTMEQLEKALAKVNSQRGRRAEMPPPREKKEKGGGRGEDKKKPMPAKQQPHPPKGDGGERGKKREATGGEGRGNEKKMKIEEKIIDKDGFAMPSLPMGPKAGTNGKSTASSSTNEKKNTEKNGEDKKWTVFVSNLDFRSTEEQIREVLDGVVEVRLLHRGMSKLHKGYGYVDVENEDAFREALKQDRVLIKGRPMYVSECKAENEKRDASFKYATSLEKNKLFVKNVHFDATIEQINSVFSQFGPVKEVRVVTHKSGKAKGVAYVDMETDEDADKAVKSNDVVLLDRKLQVFLSNPPKKVGGGLGDMIQAPPPPGGRIGHSSKLDFVPRRLASKIEDTKKEESASSSTSVEKKSNDFFRSLFNK